MAKIYGQLEAAQLHNKTSDPASPPAGLVIWRTDTGLAKIATGSGSTYVTLVDLSTAQVLASKTLTSPVLTTPVIDVASFTDQGSTPSTPSSGSTKFYSKTDGKLYYITSAGVETQVGAGSGGGGRNYVSPNPDAETSAGTWATYADAAGALPVDMTGGSATTTWTRTTSTPLRGVASFLLTKDANNRQGEGVAFAFTLDLADQAKIIAVTGDYEIASGTFATGDLGIYAVDVTNSSVIQPAGYQIVALSATKGRFIATFQTSSSGTSYRVGFHVASTSASAYTVKMDNIIVGPQATVYGAPVTSETTYTPTVGTISGFTSGPSGTWYRVGNRGFYTVRWQKNGSIGVGAAVVTISLPAGHVIDTTNGGGVANVSNVGWAEYIVTYNDLRTVNFVTTTTVAIGLGATQMVGTDFAANSYVEMQFSAPIVGWQSNVIMSSDTDTRVVIAGASGTTTGGSGAASIVIMATSDYDTHGAYSTSTGRFTAPVPGYYRATGYFNGSNNIAVGIYVNAVLIKNIFGTSAGPGVGHGSGVVKVNAGDIIDLRTSATIGAWGSGSTMTFERISGPATIAASESIVASSRLPTSGRQSIPYNTMTVFAPTTEEADTHGALTTGVFTAPVAGLYRASCTVYFTGLTANTGQAYAELQKNSTAISGVSVAASIGASSEESTGLSYTVRLLAGETLRFAVFQNNTASVARDASGFISFEKVGN